MKKLILILFCFPFLVLAQLPDSKIYLLKDIEVEEFVYISDPNWGDFWDANNSQNVPEYSEYDISTNTFVSHSIDTSVFPYLSETLSCFDPTTNNLYFIPQQHEEDSIMMGILDVSTSNISYEFLLEASQWFDESIPGIVGDTIQHTRFSLTNMEIYFSLPSDSLINKVSCDEYIWNGTIYTNSGIYTYTTTNSIGLDSVVTLDLTINSVIASISQSGDSLFAVTTPIGLTANWYNIQSEDTTTRVWLMDEGVTTFMPRFDCSYFIVVNDNGCTDTSETYSYGANAARIGSFITSPNPTTGFVNVKFDNPKSQFVMFELISNNGSKLDEFITVENNLNIDLSNYPSGSYYLYFNSEDAVQGCRLEDVQKVSTKIILNK